MKRFATEVYDAVRTGRLKVPFNAAMVMIAAPGWATRTYRTFFGKHAVGNGKETEWFVRVGRGKYVLR